MSRSATSRAFWGGDVPALKKQAWERFAVEVAKGATLAVAYEAAGYPPHASNARRLRDRPEVAARITELRERAGKRSEITVQRVVEAIGDIAFNDDAKEVSVQNRLRGLELLGRYLAIFQDNLAVNTSSDLANRMRQAQERMRAMRNVTPPTIEGELA